MGLRRIRLIPGLSRPASVQAPWGCLLVILVALAAMTPPLPAQEDSDSTVKDLEADEKGRVQKGLDLVDEIAKAQGGERGKRWQQAAKDARDIHEDERIKKDVGAGDPGKLVGKKPDWLILLSDSVVGADADPCDPGFIDLLDALFHEGYHAGQGEMSDKPPVAVKDVLESQDAAAKWAEWKLERLRAEIEAWSADREFKNVIYANLFEMARNKANKQDPLKGRAAWAAIWKDCSETQIDAMANKAYDEMGSKRLRITAMKAWRDGLEAAVEAQKATKENVLGPVVYRIDQYESFKKLIMGGPKYALVMLVDSQGGYIAGVDTDIPYILDATVVEDAVGRPHLVVCGITGKESPSGIVQVLAPLPGLDAWRMDYPYFYRYFVRALPPDERSLFGDMEAFDPEATRTIGAGLEWLKTPSSVFRAPDGRLFVFDVASAGLHPLVDDDGDLVPDRVDPASVLTAPIPPALSHAADVRWIDRQPVARIRLGDTLAGETPWFFFLDADGDGVFEEIRERSASDFVRDVMRREQGGFRGNQGADLRLVESSVDPPIISPANADGRFDEAALTAVFSLKAVSGPDPVTRLLRTTLAIADAQGTTRNEFVHVQPIPEGAQGGASTEITEHFVLDGRDAAGDLLEDGTFEWRIQAEYIMSRAPPGQGDRPLAADETVLATSAVSTGSFRIDNTPPAASAFPMAGQYVATRTPQLVLSYTDLIAGVDTSSLLVFLDGSDLTPYASIEEARASVSVPLSAALADGPHRVTAEVADHVANLRVIEVVFLVDATTPSLTVRPASGARVHTATPTLELEYADDGSGIDLNSLSMLLDGEDLTPALSRSGNLAMFPVPPGHALAEGPHLVQASVADHAGNLMERTSLFSVALPAALVVPPGAPQPVHSVRAGQTTSATVQVLDGAGIGMDPDRVATRHFCAEMLRVATRSRIQRRFPQSARSRLSHLRPTRAFPLARPRVNTALRRYRLFMRAVLPHSMWPNHAARRCLTSAGPKIPASYSDRIV